ncbi:MAG: DUF2059 domain-containing protein [Gammaproteobacteria bacterium]|nr:DUF2059 domain-containing protein [Gammaproteobacteria bacterium]
MINRTCGLFILLSLFSVGAHAVTDEKMHLIDEMLILSGSLDNMRHMTKSVANSMVNLLAKANKKITPEVAKVLKIEVINIVEEEFIAKKFVHKMSYEIYDKHFSAEELRGLVKFYKSDLGKKLKSTQPLILKETTVASQNHLRSLQPKLKSRINAALKREGLL